MELLQAIELLSTDQLKPLQQGQWADLGSGNGVFTLALANLLKSGSTIYAFDKDAKALDQIPANENGVKIEKYRADFVKQELSLMNIDGILMANSLHYVEDKISFIKKAKNWLKPGGSFLVVEYDAIKGNQWVPWPLDYSSMEKLFRSSGFSLISKIAERPSVFGRAKLYSATIRR